MMYKYNTLLRKVTTIKEMLNELELTTEERIEYEQKLKEYEYKLAALDNAWFYDEI